MITSVLKTDSVSYRPDVRFYCDLEYDPLLKMQDEDKVYGRHDIIQEMTL